MLFKLLGLCLLSLLTLSVGTYNVTIRTVHYLCAILLGYIMVDRLIVLSCRVRRISQLYSQGVRPLARDMLELQNWNWLYNATDKLTKGWLTHGARLLQQVIASAKSSEEAMQVMISSAS